MTGRKMILPGATIGIIGGGQLGRMLVFAAKSMGYNVGVLDPQIDCPAAQVADWQLCKAYSDKAALKEMAQRCQVLTYEFENINQAALANVMNEVMVPQGVELLALTQNRQREKAFLARHDFPVVPFQIVEKGEDLLRSLAVIGYPAVLKTLEGGYDGHGQVVLRTEAELAKAGKLLEKAACILEAWCPFEREVSVMVAANQAGEVAVFPVAENQHRNNILHLSFVPSNIPASINLKIMTLAKKIATTLKLQGILGIEFFIGKDGEVFINELAPRPHNSGHYSLEACNFSQFDLHILGICNRPLPEIKLLENVVMINILGQHQQPVFQELSHQPDWHVHLYGKEIAKENRKMGHITMLTKDINKTLEKLAKLSIWK